MVQNLRGDLGPVLDPGWLLGWLLGWVLWLGGRAATSAVDRGPSTGRCRQSGLLFAEICHNQSSTGLVRTFTVNRGGNILSITMVPLTVTGVRLLEVAIQTNQKGL